MAMVEVDKDEYDRLVRADKKLSALEAAGVDNWEWYGDAMDTLEEASRTLCEPSVRSV